MEEVSFKEAIEAYRNFDYKLTNCHVCYKLPEREMYIIFPFESDEFALLRFTLLNELLDGTKIFCICKECRQAIQFCASNIVKIKRRRTLLPILHANNCLICGSSSRIIFRKLPVNNSAQLVFKRFTGKLVMNKPFYLCSACEEVVWDLNELIRSVQVTEILLLEEPTMMENETRRLEPMDVLKSKTHFSFMNKDMKYVLHLESVDEIPPSLATNIPEEPIQPILEPEKKKLEIVPIRKTKRRKLFHSPVQVRTHYYYEEDIINPPMETNKSPQLILPKPSEPVNFIDVEGLEDELREVIGADTLAGGDVPFSFLVKQMEQLEILKKNQPVKPSRPPEIKPVPREEWGIGLTKEVNSTFVRAKRNKTLYQHNVFGCSTQKPYNSSGPDQSSK